MHKACVTFLLFSLLLAIPLWGQEVFVRGDNQAAMQVRTDFEKYTHYRLAGDAINSTLHVNEISWSPDFLSPATVAIQMELISSRGDLLWSKTEPVSSRPKEAVIQDLLKDLALAKPSLNGANAKPAEAGERRGTGK
jgi:hypothetical protein